MRRLVGVLPPGTLAVGAGLGVLGLASYVHLAVAGHTLDAAGMSSVSVLWSLVFIVGLGLFFPIEQEVARIVSARRVHGQPAWPVLRRGAVLAATILVALFAVLLAGSGPIADRLFAGDRSLVWVFAAAMVGLALGYVTRGVLGGLGDFGWYGVQLGVDGGLRIVMAGALGVLGIRSSLWFGLVLVFAPIASVLLTAGPVLRARGAGPEIGWAELCRGLGLLVVSALLAQVVVNIAVINVRLLDPEDVAVAGALLSALVLVRVPLFVFGSLQASLLPGLSGAVAAADAAGYRRLLGRALAVVTALGGAGAAVAVPLGPWLVRLLFDASDVLGVADFAWLAAGTCAYLWAMVLGQGVLAQGRHRDQALAWVIGTAALVAATLCPGDVAQRVELGYAAGSLVVAVVLLRGVRAWTPVRVASLERVA
ncbi:MAG: polysaccharide biosynthesis protein [Micromonosporaceae bacterium]|nr:polysaccharide biosynthesis protein [Micromonosporaceae bacterium]